MHIEMHRDGPSAAKAKGPQYALIMIMIMIIIIQSLRVTPAFVNLALAPIRSLSSENSENHGLKISPV
jgi:hypothetical protein